MLPTFCLRLALGMIAPLPLVPSSVAPPRFFRVQFLTALGLLAIAGLFVDAGVGLAFWVAFGVAAAATLLGSIVWHTDEAPLGRTAYVVGGLALAAALIARREGAALPAFDDLTGALLLGAATSAMLMGHSYLIAPAMSLAPLLRLLGLLAVALALRIGLSCFGLWEWTRQTANHDFETTLWLSARWLLGLAIPVVLAWMGWETARIRSTQSATGILYVVTIVCFLGELLAILLAEKTGLTL